MTYDAIVIGAGLAGLVSAIRLAEQGQRVLLLAKGPGASHLSGGTIDVLGYAPDLVESPAGALPDFVAAHPDHPYARLPLPLVAESIEWFKARLAPCGYVGGLAENLLLPTALGVAKPSAVVPGTMAAGDVRVTRRFVIVGFRALKDFYPAYLAGNLRRATGGTSRISARGLELSTPDGEVEASSLQLARRFEHAEFRQAVVDELRRRLDSGETVGFPAVLGLADPCGVLREMEERLEAPVFEIPTLPPSVPGIRMFEALTRALRRAGGRLLIGGRVVGADAGRGRMDGVVVDAGPRRVTYRARSFVLASGGFASGGLEMDSYRMVREAIFGLPVAGLPAPGEPLLEAGYLGRHALGRVGVAVDDRLRPVDAEGRALYANLHAAGATVAGAEPWREKSGNGISLASGYAAASAIVEAAS